MVSVRLLFLCYLLLGYRVSLSFLPVYLRATTYARFSFPFSFLHDACMYTCKMVDNNKKQQKSTQQKDANEGPGTVASTMVDHKE